MIKYFILFAFLVIAIEAAKTCKGQSDCEDDECCLNKALKTECRKRFKKDDFCNLFATFDDASKEVYKRDCPCVEGFKCKMGSDLLDLAPKCRKED